MREKCVNARSDRTGELSRRALLRVSAGLTLAGLLGPRAVADEAAPPPPAAPLPPPWWLKLPAPRSRVVMLSAAATIKTALPTATVADAMLAQALMQLTDAAAAAAAWRKVLGQSRQIVVKFNSVGAARLGTNDNLARALLGQLRTAEYDLGRVTLLEAGPGVASESGCARAPIGWAGAVRVGDGVEQLCRAVDEADAVINVGLLKTHRFAGMSAAMLNLAYGIIRRPARYHANGCAPFVGQIIASPPVAQKLRINIVNAFRILVRGGPDVDAAAMEAVEPYNALLAGFDPVATDFVAQDALIAERRRLQLGERLDVPYLSAAAEDSVGRAGWGAVERVVRELQP